MNCLDAINSIYEELLLSSNFINYNYEDFPIYKTLYIKLFIDKMLNDFSQKHKHFLNRKIDQIDYVVSIFNEINVPYVLIKGIVNSLQAYENVNLRNWNDIDILIDYNNLSKIDKKLKANGFIQGVYVDGECKSFSRKSRLFYVTQTHQLAPYIKLIGSDIIFLDINFNIIPQINKKINIEEFINNRIPQKINQNTAYILPIEKNFIQNILHCYRDITNVWQLIKRRGYRLKSFIDIYMYIKSNKIDESIFKTVIKNYNMDMYVDYVLKIVAEIFKDRNIYRFCTKVEVDHINFYGENLQYPWNISVEKRFIRSYAFEVLNKNLNYYEKELCQKNKFYLEDDVE